MPHTVLVTGASGFLGRYVARRLADAGYEVIALTRRAIDFPGVERFRQTLVNLEELSADDCRDLITPGNASVVHFAARIPGSADLPEDAFINRRMDDCVLSLCERFSLPLIYASSAGVYYPKHTPEWNNEESAVNAQGPYYREKCVTEDKGLDCCSRTGVPFAALRITAPYGAYQTARTVMKLFVERATRGFPLLYYGTGAREQDFIHADDVAEAAVLCLLKRATGLFNIAAGVPITMEDLAKTVVAAVPGCRSEIRSAGVPDPQEGCLTRVSIARATEQLGWLPRISLHEGIAQWAALNAQ
jgi:UDP-glucose 4-epimerase